jgi:hypothetical protein
MLGSEQNSTIMSLFEYAKDTFPVEARERLNKIKSIQESLLLEKNTNALLSMQRKQRAFYQNLITDIAAKNFNNHSDPHESARDLVFQSAIAKELFGGSDYKSEWEKKTLDMYCPQGRYIPTSPIKMGIVEASYLLNAHSLSLINDLSTIPEDMASLYSSINTSELKADPLPPKI